MQDNPHQVSASNPSYSVYCNPHWWTRDVKNIMDICHPVNLKLVLQYLTVNRSNNNCVAATSQIIRFLLDKHTHTFSYWNTETVLNPWNTKNVQVCLLQKQIQHQSQQLYVIYSYSHLLDQHTIVKEHDASWFSV